MASPKVLQGRLRQRGSDTPEGVLGAWGDWIDKTLSMCVGSAPSGAACSAGEANRPPSTTAGLLPMAFKSGRLNLAGLQSVLDLRNRFGYALPMGADLSVFVDDAFWSAAASSK